ncbi:MAG: hypothetical protein ACRDGA_00840 [Bacteroidota bacterium]
MINYANRIAFSLVVALIAATLPAVSQTSKTYVVPTVITNHYDKSEPESHGVVTVLSAEEKLKVEVRDLARNTEYAVTLLEESSGKRTALGKFKTDARGSASTEYPAKGLLKTFNALLVLNGEDVIQYAQLHEATHGCICKHSGGTIVTRKMNQECYECPCGVKYEVCCGMKK